MWYYQHNKVRVRGVKSCNTQLMNMTPPCGDKTDFWVETHAEGLREKFF